METVSAASIGITPFDTEELVRLRIANEKGWSTAAVVLLTSAFADPISFSHVEDYIVGVRKEEEEKEDEDNPIMVRVWRRLRGVEPLFPKRSFVVNWFLLYSPELTSANRYDREEPFVQEVQSFYEVTEGNAGPFSSLDFLNTTAESYQQEQSVQMEEELQRLERDSAITLELDQVEAAPTSLIEYTNATTIFTVEREEDNVITDAEGFYNEVECGRFLPLAIYNGTTLDSQGGLGVKRELYKLYKGVEAESLPPFQRDWLSSTPGTFSFRLFTGTRDTLPTATAKDYTLAVYNWREGKIRIEIPFSNGFNQAKAEAIMAAYLPLTFVSRQDKNIEGTIKVRDFLFKDSLFAEMVMNDPVFKPYIRIRETSLLVMTNRRPTYRMGTFGSDEYLEFRIENRESKINEPFLQQDGETFLMDERTPYAAIIITASSGGSVDTFLRIIPFLLGRYLEQEERLLREYRELIPSYGLVATSAPPSAAIIETNIKALENVAPAIFSNNYARSCQSKHQPVILSPEEEEAWKKQTFSYKGGKRNRETLLFPINGEGGISPKIFGCPSSTIPFVGLVDNTRGNKDMFPYLPCCFTESKTTGNYYAAYYKGEELVEPSKKIKSTNIIDTNKFAISGQFGTLPRNINFLLQLRTPGTWYRQGTVISPSSIIHSLAMIPGFGEAYPVYGSSAEKEDYVGTVLRPLIASQVYPELLKQEFPSTFLSTISSNLVNPQVYFDPKYYFRALEEAYNINVVIFTLTETEALGDLETPYAKGIAYRPYLDPSKPTLMFYKHEGVESNANNWPQCELIMNNDFKGTEEAYFAPPALVDLINDALAAAGHARTWSFDPTQGTLLLDNEANVVLDISSILDFDKLKGQYIDANGKLRFVLYDDMTIATPLLPPINTVGVESSNVQLVSVERVIAFVQELRQDGVDALVYAMNTDSNDKVVGVWWYIGAPIKKTLFFIPTTPSALLQEYKELYINYLPYPAIFSSGDADRNHYDYLSRAKYLLLEVLQYLFILNLSSSAEVGIEEFIDEYTVVKEGHIYAIQDVDRYFPVAESIEDALIGLEETAPTFVERGRVILDSQDLQDRLLSYLSVMLSLVDGRLPSVPTVMPNFFQTASDFTVREGQLVFDNYAKVSSWIQRVRQEEWTSVVATAVTEGYRLLLDPYVLQTVAGYFLVQNVLDGNYERALKVAKDWRGGVNAGFNAPATGEGTALVFHVNRQGGTDEQSGEGDDYLLRYTDGAYAAMLYLSE